MSIYTKEGEETRKKILIAAKSEFAAKGFDGARMNCIAVRAGVNQALIHYYFSTKNSLYKNIFQRLLGDISIRYTTELKMEIDSWNSSPVVKVCAAIYIIVTSEINIQDEEFHRIIIHEFADESKNLSELLKEYILTHIYSLADAIDEGIKIGLFQNLNSRMLSFSIFSLIKALIKGNRILKNTEIFKESTNNNYKEIYNFMLEFVFKLLKKNDKEFSIHEFDEEKINKLDVILKRMSDEINKF